MLENVAQAVEEIRALLPGATVTAHEDGEGGAHVIVDAVDLGQPYVQQRTWVGFHITRMYPYADVYPHFVRGDLQRTDGQPLGEGTSPNVFLGRPAIQLSRRSNRLNPLTDTAALKLQKVLLWLRERR